jgi:hypothetical protein
MRGWRSDCDRLAEPPRHDDRESTVTVVDSNSRRRPPEGGVATMILLTPAEEQALQELALRRGVSTAHVLGEAVIEKKFFSDQRRNGNEVVLRLPDGTLSPVRWVRD